MAGFLRLGRWTVLVGGSMGVGELSWDLKGFNFIGLYELFDMLIYMTHGRDKCS